MLNRLILITSTLTIMSGSAMAMPAATLDDVTGTVLIDQGHGFVKVSTSSELVAGSRIMLSRDGRATLVYAGGEGCKIKLSSNTITTVTSSAACGPVAQVAGQAPPAVVVPPVPVPMIVGTAIGMAAIEAVAQTIAVLQPSASD